jgi:acylphosphatase/pimeloyl-ACP methyl ester carboxylesterase
VAKKLLGFRGEELEISYERIKGGDFRVLFLHGWGANKEMMSQAFKEQFKECDMLYLDLPGFGGSSVNHSYDSFEAKDIVAEFLKSIDFTPSMIVGHSFGGKIATLLSPEYLVLLSSAGLPKKKSFKVKSKIALTKMLKGIAPKGVLKLFRSSDVASMSEDMYGTFKKVVDEDFSNEFENYKGEAYLFWGREDSATPLEYGEKIASKIEGSKFFEMEGDHFFFLKKGDIIRQKLAENIEVLRRIDLKSYRFIVKGKVQGVGFRNFTQNFAKNLDIRGYVKNLEDGSVEVVANLKDAHLDFFIEGLKKGPVSSDVQSVEKEVIDLQEFSDFEIRY